MLEVPPPSTSKKADKDSPASAALKCAYQLMQQRIISNPKDMMGILLYGTEASKFQDGEVNSKRSLAFPHCYLLTDLDVPSAGDVKALKALLEDDEGASDLLVATNETVSMTSLLFCANQIFTRKAPNFGSRRLFIVTDNDDPHAGDKDLKSQAATRAKDLYDLGVIIELFPVSSPQHEFDRTKFYDDLVYRDPSDPDAPLSTMANIQSAPTDGLSLLASLLSSINSKQTPKRALFSTLPLELGPGCRISVKGYNVLHRQAPARSCYIYLDGPRAKVAIGETTRLSADTARTVVKTELKKAYRFGGEHVLFTPEEQKQLKDFGPPGITVIGFKPLSMLPLWATVAKSTFIYPSEESFVGSTRVFAALWTKLLRDRIMGLAWYIARANANPQLVAMIASPSSPSGNDDDDDNNNNKPGSTTTTAATASRGALASIPAGIWLSPLPFADDVRPAPPARQPPLRAPDALTDRMRTVVQQLQLPGAVYDPARYPSPSLQWHYRILQCLALEEEVPDEAAAAAEDKTRPRARQIDKRAGAYALEWARALESEAERWGVSAGAGAGAGVGRAGIKRQGEAGEGGQSKRARKEGEEDDGQKQQHGGAPTLRDMDIKKLRAASETGGLARCSVAELKVFLESKGLRAVGKKADLVEKMEQWIEEH